MAQTLSDVRCPACLGAEFEMAVIAPDPHYGNDGTWSYERCRGCGALHQEPLPANDELASFYPSDYYAFAHPRNERRSLGQFLRKVFYPQGMRNDFDLPSGRMLDVGCGDGWVLDRYRSRGWDAIGVEPSVDAAKRATAKGRTVHAGLLEDQGFAEASFDLVRANHSFEHVPNPDTVLAEMLRILRPGGRLVLGVPSPAGLAARVFGRHWWYLGAPVHTFLYTPDSIERLLERFDFEAISVSYNSDDGGFLGSLQILINARRGVRSSDGALMRLLPVRVVFFWLAKVLDALRLGDCIEVRATKPRGAVAR